MTLRILAGLDAWLYPDQLALESQREVLTALRDVLANSPVFVPAMPRTGKPLSVRMTNCGPLGWVSDAGGYRYQERHPVTGVLWPPIPLAIAAIRTKLLPGAPPPEACLINYYAADAKMGLHQDRDERVFDVPVLSLSLGDTARFRLSGLRRTDQTRGFPLRSSDAFIFGGASRLAFHGIDRIQAGISSLLPEGGRFNLTLRRVNPPHD